MQTDPRVDGRYYTPISVVRYIVRRTLDPLLAGGRPATELRILEPACGEGVFLREAYRRLRDAAPDHLGRGPLGCLFGVDRDPRAVARARLALAEDAGLSDPVEARQLEMLLARHIRCGDALIGPDFHPPTVHPPPVAAFDWQRDFAEVFRRPSSGFDAVIGNPPYVNIRRLTKHHGEPVNGYLRGRFRCAQGAYDLYVLFFELAWRLLRPGGVCGMIVPNKIASLQYAAACRSMLQEQTALIEITDLSRCRVFPSAGVYPYVLIWRKEAPAANHRVAVVPIDSLESLPTATVARRVLQSRLSAQDGWHLHGSLDVDTRVPTQPLEEVAELHSGTTGFQAAKVAARLRERQDLEATPGFEFVVTGNIDRFVIRPGQVRFMNRRFARPFLPDDPDSLTARKRALYRGPKILVGGMSQRLEAAFDPGGLALGVQLYAVVPKIDPFYLLAILNSKLLSHLFRLRFQAKRLSGNYLSINKGQLAALPIRRIDPECVEERCFAGQLATLARQMIAAAAEDTGAVAGGPRGEVPLESQQSLDQQIDQLVYQLYALTAEEVAGVEAGCAGM